MRLGVHELGLLDGRELRVDGGVFLARRSNRGFFFLVTLRAATRHKHLVTHFVSLLHVLLQQYRGRVGDFVHPSLLFMESVETDGLVELPVLHAHRETAAPRAVVGLRELKPERAFEIKKKVSVSYGQSQRRNVVIGKHVPFRIQEVF